MWLRADARSPTRDRVEVPRRFCMSDFSGSPVVDLRPLCASCRGAMKMFTGTMRVFTGSMSGFAAPMRILTAAVRIFTALKNKMG